MERTLAAGQAHKRASMDFCHGQARHQSHGALWSTFGEICKLVNVPGVSPASDKMLFQHVHFRSGQRIYRAGQPFDTFYIVNSGALKTSTIGELGHEQVLNFPMKGDMLGMDSIHLGKYLSEAQALTECDLIQVSYARLNSLSRATPHIERLMYHLMSRELARRETVIGMLGTLAAEARVAHFLITLSERFAEMGYSKQIFNLRMTRQEIGSYLGLTLETVSRTMSAFNDMGLITVNQRMITILDEKALAAVHKLAPPHARSRPAGTRRTSEAE